MACLHQFAEDAAHIAIAPANGVDYLVTWNLRHIANATMRSWTLTDIHGYGNANTNKLFPWLGLSSGVRLTNRWVPVLTATYCRPSTA